MYSLKNLWNAEPARIVTTVMALIAVLATYGLNLVPDPDKFATALGAILVLLSGGETIRSQVTPPAHLPEPPVPVMSATVQGAK